MAPATTLETQQGLVITFDGEVLEVFDYQGSRRIHVRQMAEITLGGGFMGGTGVSIALKAGQTYAIQIKLSDAERSALEQLIAEVDAARSV